MPDVNMDLASSASVSPAEGAGSNGLFVAIGVMKWVMLAFALACPYLAAFLIYPLPAFSDALWDLRWACWFFLFFFTLSAIVRRRWGQTAIFVAAWAWMFFAPPFAQAPLPWLAAQGFGIQARSAEAYLSTCELFQFTETGTQRTFGVCGGADRGTVFTQIFYDPSGEIASPLSERTPEWRRAMEQRLATRPLLEKNVVGRHFLGDFYEVVIPSELLRGG